MTTVDPRGLSRSKIYVPYWFACCVLMSTRGIHVEFHRRSPTP